MGNKTILISCEPKGTEQLGERDDGRMIFVTVGTHEQPFDRLVQRIDRLKGEGTIQEDVVIQTGFSKYEPSHCKWQKFFPYQEMQMKVSDARIVITHGGPSSFIMPLQLGKIPVVIPRHQEYGEHVNDHQVEFVKAVEERMGMIIPVYEMDDLESAIVHYDEKVARMPFELNSNNKRFMQKFEDLVEKMF